MKKHLHPIIINNEIHNDLNNIFINNKIILISFPLGHNLKETWSLQLDLVDGSVLEFFSETIPLNNWSEINRICINFPKKNERFKISGKEIKSIYLEDYFSEKIEKIIYEDENFIIDCGVVINIKELGDLYICGGISSGSVTAKIPKINGPGEFSPEISIEKCKRAPP